MNVSDAIDLRSNVGVTGTLTMNQNTLYLIDATSDGVYAIYSTAGYRKLYLDGVNTNMYGDSHILRCSSSAAVYANLGTVGLRIGSATSTIDKLETAGTGTFYVNSSGDCLTRT